MPPDIEIVDSLEESDQPDQPVSEAIPTYDGGEVRIELGQLEDAEGELDTPVAETPVAEVETAAPETETLLTEVTDAAPIARPSLPPIDPRIQAELVTLRQQAAQAKEREDNAAFQTALTHRQRELEEQDGLAPERAQAIAQQEIGAVWKAYQLERQTQSRIAEAEARVEVATILSGQHGVPIRELMRHATLPAMLAAAEQATAQSSQAKEIASLKAQVAKLTKESVPAQRFSSAQGALTPASNRATKLDRYIDGEALSDKEVAELFR